MGMLALMYVALENDRHISERHPTPILARPSLHIRARCAMLLEKSLGKTRVDFLLWRASSLTPEFKKPYPMKCGSKTPCSTLNGPNYEAILT